MTPIEAIGRFSECKVLLVGDVGVDRYVHGHSTRLCPEAPVPVFSPTTTESRPGLAGNVAANLASLGARVKLCSITGDDQNGFDLQDSLDRLGVVEVEKYLVKSQRPTTIKTRYYAGHHILLRVDEEVTLKFDVDLMQRFIQGLKEEIKWADIVVIQDYAKGLISQELIHFIMNHSSGKFVVVDPSPKQDPMIYKGVSYLKPNLHEFDLMASKLQDFTVAEFVRKLKIEGVLITGGSEGMVAYESCTFREIPAIDHKLPDVCGAGDTVTAVLALGLASGLSFYESSELANLAASVVIGKFGTATLTRTELEKVVYGEN